VGGRRDGTPVGSRGKTGFASAGLPACRPWRNRTSVGRGPTLAAVHIERRNGRVLRAEPVVGGFPGPASGPRSLPGLCRGGDGQRLRPSPSPMLQYRLLGPSGTSVEKDSHLL
jgi:hypothetical protein